ncbi:MAG: thioredoxin family protein [Candidatus Izemoplasmataceae bacterium]|uniref:thioredoxin family protein n=1 Tax=Liberiplasma polymorphum TaxID=3374570 RepID=UPI003771AD6D
MAKKRSSRKKLDPIKLSFFIIFGLLLLFTAVTFIHNLQQSRYHIKDWSEVTTKHEEGTYFVYVYSDSCVYCQQIRGDVSNFVSGNEQDMPLYYVDWTLVPQSLRGTAITGTPSLLVIHDGVWVNTIVGPGPIVNAFDQVNNGTFQP